MPLTIQTYLGLLADNTQRLTGFVCNLSAEELRWKKESAQWNILEIAEHILIAERLVHLVLNRPSPRIVEQSEIYGAAKLKKILIDMRDRKVEASQSLFPKGALNNGTEFGQQLRELRSDQTQRLHSGELTIDNRTYAHPLLGEMTVSDWMNFILLHADRHLEQMKDRLAGQRSS